MRSRLAIARCENGGSMTEYAAATETERKFETYAKALEDHVEQCSSLSSLRDHLLNEPVMRIVELGTAALPLIAKRWRVFDEQDMRQPHILPGLVRCIAGSAFSIPNELTGKIHLLHEYTIRWIDKNAHLLPPYVFSGTPQEEYLKMQQS